MRKWSISGWTEEDINQLELNFLNNSFYCKDTDSVDVTVMYAKYLSKIGVNSDNYPVYLKLIRSANHWVVDALVGKNPPDKYFNQIQPNTFIIAECFKSFTNLQRGGIYITSLLVLLGLLMVNYKNPEEGLHVYKMSISDLNNLCKHLNETKDQNDPVNKIILELLDKLASLNDPGSLTDNQYIATLATQANNIRGKFLDATKHLNEAIPDNLLIATDYKNKEIPPSFKN